MPRKIMLVFFLFISEVCYAQVVVSEFNLSDINRGGMLRDPLIISPKRNHV